MHELSIVQALLEQIESEVNRSGIAGSVQTVDLVIGRLSGVHVDSIRFAFEMLSPETIAAGAELRIDEPLATLTCRACQHREAVDELTMSCPVCASGDIVIDGGQELLLQSIELEQ